MKFRIVIYDYVVNSEVSFEGDLSSVFNYLDQHSTVVYTIGEINRAVIEGVAIPVSNSSTATITRLV